LIVLLEQLRLLQDSQIGLTADKEIEGMILVIMVNLMELKSIMALAAQKKRLPGSGKMTSVDQNALASRYRTGALEDQLQALTLTPSYIAGTRTARDVHDARKTIGELRALTSLLLAGDQGSAMVESHALTTRSKAWVMGAGSPSLFWAPFPVPLPADPSSSALAGIDVRTEWIGFCVATAFFIFGVLGLYRTTNGPRGGLWSVSVVLADLQRNQHVLRPGASGRELWFWKLFCTAIGVEAGWHFVHIFDRGPFFVGGDEQFWSVRAKIQDLICTWASTTGTRGWHNARKTLSAVVWPHESLIDWPAECLWTEAVGEARPAVDLREWFRQSYTKST
jgi:hypothetical protein